MRVDASKIGEGAGGWRAERMRAFKALWFSFFSKAIKIEKGHSKDSTSLADLPPQFPSSALIIILTKATSKWAALHWPSGAVTNMTS